MSPTITTIDPATGADLATYDAHDEAAVDAALARAHTAYESWSAVPLDERCDLLRSVGKLLTERREDYAALITAEMGKPLAEALAEIDKCAWNCDVVAESAPSWLGDHEVASGAARSWLSYEPMGVVFAVMPWNYPFWQVLRFASAALVAGDAGVLKHSPNVTGCALAIESLFADAGAPAGLFTTLVLADEQLGEMTPRIVGDARVAAVTLTGSERAGEAIGAAAGRSLKKSVLELGGSDPFVVLDDADLASAAKVAVKSRYGNGGQSCIAAKRFIVADAVADEFVRLFVEQVAALVVGDPTDSATTIGPMARDDLRDGLARQVSDSVAEGAVLVTGGSIHRRTRLLLRADRARPRPAGHDLVRRGDLRSRRRDRPRPRRRPRRRARQRHDVRPRRLRLVAVRPRARRRSPDPLRRPVRQRDGRFGPAAAVRRHRPQRLRPRAVGRGHARVHQRAHDVRQRGGRAMTTLDHRRPDRRRPRGQPRGAPRPDGGLRGIEQGMSRLAGKVALITGVGGGMGVAAARRFAAEGARVVGCDLDAEGAARTEALVRAEGGEITVMGGVDLGDADAARTWVDAAVATYDGIDVLYNNASTQRFGAIDELGIDEWDFTMRNELDLVYYTVRAAWPHLKAHGGGSIINVGSIAALRGVEFMPQNAHSAAKGGVIALTLQLVVEGGPHGIRANTISPGMTETPNTAPLLADPPERFRTVVLDRIPLGRHGQPEDVVNAAVFLASDESSWISGTNIVIDGGASVLG